MAKRTTDTVTVCEHIDLENATADRLHAQLRGVKFIIIDEVPMNGCKALLDIYKRICIAARKADWMDLKKNAFGGFHIIFAGVFDSYRQ